MRGEGRGEVRGERKELILIHIIGSAVTIHDIQCNNKMEFTNKRVLPHTGVQYFSLHTHGLPLLSPLPLMGIYSSTTTTVLSSMW